MRLTHLKLAGFKSFVDPTTLHIHGQRVGVVGPNGCGKSNVMESIRWVLGESSAKELRGDSMDAVIFNGSANRKPISRASVELIFDNSLGGASGEWSQYAEISVKRVIERDKGSSYYINNTAVRRRDVADLFLGTGLGGRAYAIIGQNTISRIIEARPEEMRVFLEEAAGISKYKERRRETELRLRDTRDNLLRVEDIRQEMVKQITRLESQAAVTLQYHELQKALKLAQGQSWLLKKRDAGVAWEKSQRLVEKLVNELESQVASLRHSEAQVENLRQQYQEASSKVQDAQAAYYEANADLARLEQQVKHTQEARERLQQQLQQMTTQSQKLQDQQSTFKDNLQKLLADQQAASAQESEATQALAELRSKLPEAERAFQSALHLHTAAQRTLSEADQAIRLENTNADHMRRNLGDLEQRKKRLNHDSQTLLVPDEARLVALQAEHEAAQEEISRLENGIQQARLQEQQQREEINTARENLLAQERMLAQSEARVAALTRIQESIGKENHLDDWLKSAGLTKGDRLWQRLKIEEGWETAVEAVLGSRLNAMLQPTYDLSTKPGRAPAAITLGFLSDVGHAVDQSGELTPLLSVLHIEGGLHGVLSDWLSQVYLCDDEDANRLSTHLRPGQLLVNRHGDIYTRHSLSLHAAQSEMNGVLERQRELDALKSELPAMHDKAERMKAAVKDAESKLHELRQTIEQQQQHIKASTQSQHQRHLELQRLTQQRQHAIERRQSLQNELQTLEQTHKEVAANLEQKLTAITALQNSLTHLQEERQQAQGKRHSTESELAQIRSVLQKAEREAQEKTFNQKLLLNSINDLESRIKSISEEMEAIQMRQHETEAMLAAAKMDTLQGNLEVAVNLKQVRESELASFRDAMTVAEQGLQVQERQRLQTEQSMHPLRDKLEQSRLAEQQSRLHFEQCQQGLRSTGLQEDMLSLGLSAQAKLNEVESRIDELSANIEQLGPVNLAALQELESERERKTYLDSQSIDLEQAVATLEDAIRKIDRETRGRLQATYEEANRHFGELFATLFGGGQARLEMLGDEILDTGMQVFAQPPGKKNSTIHLLSGGEKALTALALVFALFRLNPAPFCLMDEVDAPLDDSNTERFCNMVKKMSERTQFMFVSHNKITMEMAQQLIGVTMQESGVSRIVEVDMEAAMQMQELIA